MLVSSIRFAFIEFSFALLSLFSNPYRVCRKFLQKKGAKEIYAYGETPLETYRKIAAVCGVGPNDEWLELGAGRGKGCFWIANLIGCRVRGIEWVPQFVWMARALKTVFSAQRLFSPAKYRRDRLLFRFRRLSLPLRAPISCKDGGAP